MNRIPFDPYDFFGFLGSGLVAVAGMELIFGFPEVLQEDLSLVEGALLILGVYVAGQILATPAKALFEDIIVGRILKRPNVNLFKQKPHWLPSLIFPGFYKPLPEARCKRILDKARRAGVEETGEALFLHVRYHPLTLKNERLMQRLDAFLNKYGFARNLSFTALLVTTGLLAKTQLLPNQQLTPHIAISLVATILLFYRFLKFYRQYSYELFNTYAGISNDVPSAQISNK